MSSKKNLTKFELAGKLDEVLNLAPTSKIAKEALEIIASTYGLRCVPIGLPAGRQAVSLMGERDKSLVTSQAAEKPGLKRKAEEKSSSNPNKDTYVSWRKHPEYIKLQKKHDDLVGKVKDPTNSAIVSTLKEEMSMVEDEMRIFHDEVLKGNIPGVPPPRAQAQKKKSQNQSQQNDVEMHQSNLAAASAANPSPAPAFAGTVQGPSPIPSLAQAAVGSGTGLIGALSARFSQSTTSSKDGGRVLRSRSKPRESPK